MRIVKKIKRERLIKELDKLIESVPWEEIDYIELTKAEIKTLLGYFGGWAYLFKESFTYEGIPVKVKK